MEILWWWAPAAVVTLLSIAWISWYGRDGRGEIDRDEAVKRMAQALENQNPRPADRLRQERPRDRSTGIAVRPTRTVPPNPEAASTSSTPPSWSGGPGSA